MRVLPRHYLLGIFVLLMCWCIPSALYSAEITAPPPSHAPRVEISPAQRSGSFIEGATFELPIVINTRGQSVNTIKLDVRFDPQKLSVVNESGGTSIIGIWSESPTFSNSAGSERLTGIINNGIVTDYGVLVTITFRALSPGEASVSIHDDSLVLLNDGSGTEAIVERGRATFTILPRPPGGVTVFSSTHPIQDKWYNNSNPIIEWPKDPGVTGYSYVLDDKPNTIPGNSDVSADTKVGYQDVQDGIWYFHVKALKDRLWGEATHVQLRVDTQPPAPFVPSVNHLSQSGTSRAFVAFSTVDALSGMDHYEVATLDTSSGAYAPLFVESRSPYLLILTPGESAEVIVRAFDRAGNASDNLVTVRESLWVYNFLRLHLVELLASVLLLCMSAIVIHFFFTHRVIAQTIRARDRLNLGITEHI